MAKPTIKDFEVPEYTPEQLRQLAEDVVDRKVFATWMINGFLWHTVKHVFFPAQSREPQMKNLYQMWESNPTNPRQMLRITRDPEVIVHLFEYKDKATKNTFFGYPIFLQCKGLKRKYAHELTQLMAVVERERRNPQ